MSGINIAEPIVVAKIKGRELSLNIYRAVIGLKGMGPLGEVDVTAADIADLRSGVLDRIAAVVRTYYGHGAAKYTTLPGDEGQSVIRAVCRDHTLRYDEQGRVAEHPLSDVKYARDALGAFPEQCFMVMGSAMIGGKKTETVQKLVASNHEGGVEHLFSQWLLSVYNAGSDVDANGKPVTFDITVTPLLNAFMDRIHTVQDTPLEPL